MEGQRQNLGRVYGQGGGEEYGRELDSAIRAVQMACFLCRRMQGNSAPESDLQGEVKDHRPPVTVAAWSVQSIVSLVLTECLGSGAIAIFAEQDLETLSTPSASSLLQAVTETVNECIAEAPRFGLHLKPPLSASELLEGISSCKSTGNPTGKFWALGSVDGALGFADGDQHAVSLALIEEGEVVLGVLGYPNYPMRKEWLTYPDRYRRIMSKLTSPAPETWEEGFVLYAKKGSGKAWIQPQLHENKTWRSPNSTRLVRLSTIENPALATFCNPTENPNSSHSFAAGLAHSVGLRRKRPVRVPGKVKYAAIARGDAEIFLKFGRAGRKEKIWDHAAGVIIIQEAGGVVTDAGGNPLDFSKGVCLEGLDRGIVACSGHKLHGEIMEAMDASWSSSGL